MTSWMADEWNKRVEIEKLRAEYHEKKIRTGEPCDCPRCVDTFVVVTWPSRNWSA